MRSQLSRMLVAATSAVLLLTTLALVPAASASSSGGVPFDQAHFSGYASGDDVHVNAVTVGSTNVADVDQAFSGASTATSGLTTENTDPETGAVVQPALSSSVNAYGRGTGLEVGVGTSTVSGKDPNQILLAGLAESTAQPNAAATVKQIGPINLSPIADVTALTGEADSVYDANNCPIGQPISYGAGYAANAKVLTLTGFPTVNTTGNTSTTATAQTTSYDILTPNNDGTGTFGLSSTSSDVIAPVTTNLLGLASVVVQVSTAGGVSAPVTLTANATGEGAGATVKLSTDDVISVGIKVGSTTTYLLKPTPVANLATTIPLNLNNIQGTLGGVVNALAALASSLPGGSALASLLTNPAIVAAVKATGSISGVLSTLGIDLNLGQITIDGQPHAIGGASSSPPSTTGGTSASGAIDLVKVQLGINQPFNTTKSSILTIALPALNIVNLEVGHLEASANLAAPIDCTIPVLKTSTPTSVTAGNPFTYTITVPSYADASLLQCSLSNLSVTDNISDVSGTGKPTFQVTGDTATYDTYGKTSSTPIKNSFTNTATVSPKVGATTTTSTVTWTGLQYNLPPKVSDPATPPDVLTITVAVPKNSPAGTIQDTVNVSATASGCTGGASGVTGVGNGATLTGSYHLVAPTVAAVGAASTLPFTGAMGGLWQPIAGVAVLGLGGGALALVRRSRRRSV